jgi:hypothetical protein
MQCFLSASDPFFDLIQQCELSFVCYCCHLKQAIARRLVQGWWLICTNPGANRGPPYICLLQTTDLAEGQNGITKKLPAKNLRAPLEDRLPFRGFQELVRCCELL